MEGEGNTISRQQGFKLSCFLGVGSTDLNVMGGAAKSRSLLSLLQLPCVDFEDQQSWAGGEGGGGLSASVTYCCVTSGELPSLSEPQLPL